MGSMNILGIKKKEKNKGKNVDSLLNRGREEMQGEADRTRVVNATFVSLFTKQLIVIRC